MYTYLGCVFQLHLIHGMPRAVFTGVALSQGKRVLQKRVGERSTTSAFLSVDREKNKQTMFCSDKMNVWFKNGVITTIVV